MRFSNLQECKAEVSAPLQWNFSEIFKICYHCPHFPLLGDSMPANDTSIVKALACLRTGVQTL